MGKRALLAPENSASMGEGASWPSAASRPLSDIRELTETSLPVHVLSRKSRANSLAPSHRTNLAYRRSSFEYAANPPRIHEPPSSSSEYSSTPDRLSFFAIPQTSVPRRSSSQTQRSRPQHVQKLPAQQSIVPNRGHSRSPVKDVGPRLGPIRSEPARPVPSETIVRNPHSLDILDCPRYKHPRMKLEIHLSAPIFVGGSTMEGFVKCIVDNHERFRPMRSIALGTLSLDLIGFEDAGAGRRASFLSLGAELIDTSHPPPVSMALSAGHALDEDSFWPLCSSTSCLAFCLSLPLDTGPAPFRSKYGNIRFVLSTTAVIREASKYYNVRVSENVDVLPSYDPEKVLASLPVPLTTFDELRMRKNGNYEYVSVTAGLHRRIWVSGNNLFADVHISNRSRKTITRLQLSLERDILCHKYAGNTSANRSVFGARVVQDRHQAIINTTELHTKDSGWHGVGAFSSDTRTVVLEIPRGHATVQGGRYLEIQFFLNILVFVSRSRSVGLQLPVTVVHINSLDAIPNAVGQVAVAMKERRGDNLRQQGFDRTSGRQHHHSSPEISSSPPLGEMSYEAAYNQGCVFAAPRKDWMARHQAEQDDLVELRRIVDSSPRKYRLGATARDMSVSQARRHAETVQRGRPGAQLDYRIQEGPRLELKRSEPDRMAERRPRIKPSLESLQSILTGRVQRKVKESISVPHIRPPKAILGPHSLGMAAMAGLKDENSRVLPARLDVRRRPLQRSGTGKSEDSVELAEGQIGRAGRSVEPGWI